MMNGTKTWIIALILIVVGAGLFAVAMAANAEKTAMCMRGTRESDSWNRAIRRLLTKTSHTANRTAAPTSANSVRKSLTAIAP